MHTQEVAAVVAAAGGTPEMVAAAHLHDVVEDTPTTEADVLREFGPAVADLVAGLTDQIPLTLGNGKRAELEFPRMFRDVTELPPDRRHFGKRNP